MGTYKLLRCVALGAVLCAALTGCSSTPKLKQVDADAVERPVNSPEAIAVLKAKHGE